MRREEFFSHCCWLLLSCFCLVLAFLLSLHDLVLSTSVNLLFITFSRVGVKLLMNFCFKLKKFLDDIFGTRRWCGGKLTFQIFDLFVKNSTIQIVS